MVRNSLLDIHSRSKTLHFREIGCSNTKQESNQPSSRKMQECLTPQLEHQDGDITVKVDLLVMTKTREFSPGRKEGRGYVEGRDIPPSLGDILGPAPQKNVNSYDPNDLTCLFYIKASLPNLRQIEVKR